MRKCVVLLLVACLVVSSLITLIVSPTSVCAVSRPSVPQFSLKIVSHPYDVAPTYTMNPYTGETVTASSGYHVENKTIEVTIKNQPFSSYTASDGSYVNLYYNISVKPHYNDKWGYYPMIRSQFPLIPEKGDYTVVAFGPNAYTSYNGDGDPITSPYFFQKNLPDSGQLDFCVEALIGYYTIEQEFWPIRGYKYMFFGESSGWSEIQTITVSDGSIVINSQPSVSFNDNGSSSSIDDDDVPLQVSDQLQPPVSLFNSPFFMLGVGVLFCGIVVAVIMTILRRHLKTSIYFNNELS